MKNLVIDSGISVKWFVAETDSGKALQILKDYQSEKLSFLAPNLIYAEFGNIIWKKQIFQGLDLQDADFAIEEFKRISFTLAPVSSLFDDAYRIAVRHKRAFYDSLYLALAQRENCRFATADEKLVNAVRQAFPDIVLLANWK